MRRTRRDCCDHLGGDGMLISRGPDRQQGDAARRSRRPGPATRSRRSDGARRLSDPRPRSSGQSRRALWSPARHRHRHAEEILPMCGRYTAARRRAASSRPRRTLIRTLMDEDWMELLPARAGKAAGAPHPRSSLLEPDGAPAPQGLRSMPSTPALGCSRTRRLSTSVHGRGVTARQSTAQPSRALPGCHRPVWLDPGAAGWSANG